MDRKQTCNLSNVNVLAFVNEDNTIDYSGLYKAFELTTRVGYRTTCVDLEIPQWDIMQKRDRLLGVSLSGWFDFVDATGITHDEQKKILSTGRNIVIKAGEEYAKELGLNAPLISTTIKPSGSSSQLFGESAGVHRTHSKHYIRRVRIASNDPLLKVCEELGYNISPEVGQDWDTCKTKVVDFYVESKAKRFKKDVSAIEQLEDYIMFQDYWSQHNTSITVHCRENEWDGVEQYMYEHWDKFVSVSFISFDDSFYQLLPYEEITEEQYIELSKNVQPFDQSLLYKYEVKEIEEDELSDDQCSSGICSIR